MIAPQNELHATPSDGAYVRLRDLKRLILAAHQEGFSDNARILGPKQTAFGNERITLQEAPMDQTPESRRFRSRSS